MNVTYNKEAWQCPYCKKYKRTRMRNTAEKTAICCGHKFLVSTDVEEVVKKERIITSVIDCGKST